MIRILLALVIVAPTFAAATRPAWEQRLLPQTDAWQKIEQHYIFNNGTEPESLDPAVITGVPEFRLVEALFQGLAQLDPETLEPRPGLAAWEISDDGLVYTFALRANLRWSDGSALTARDFVRSWQRVLAPKTGCQYAYQLFAVKNAEAFNRGQITSFDEVGVTAIDDRTLRVTLHGACGYFLDLCAFGTLYPVPLAVIEAHGDRWTRPENFVSNGPFRLDEWKPRQHIRLTPNPHYRDREIVKLTEVTVLPYDDLETAYKLYQLGKIHWLPGIPLTKIDEIRHHPDYYVAPYFGTYFYRFNVTKPPLDDARVRRALCLALDRRVITDQIVRGGQRPTTSFCPSVAGYEPPAGLAYDREAALALWREAGYAGAGAKPPPVLEILYNTSEAHKQIAEAVGHQWKEVLGIQVQLRNAEWKVYLDELNQLNYDVARSAWIGDYGDPNTFLDMWVKDGGNNRTGWSNARYEELLRQAQTARDPAQRLAAFAAMEKILIHDEVPIMPIYYYVSQGMLREEVMGWYENVRDRHPLHYIWLEPVE